MYEIKDTTMRYLCTLRMIPQSPGYIDVGMLADRLSDQGYSVTKRTIQRDLNKLSLQFPLTAKAKDEGRANLWYWAEGTEPMDIPQMSPLIALTFSLVESFLDRILPSTVTSYLSPHFKRANSLLSQLNSTHFARWHEKIRIIPRGQQLIPAVLKQEILEVIYEALLNEKQFEATYVPRDSKKEKQYLVHPLGLVFRHEIIYLVCTLRNYENVVHLPLHRFKAASIIDKERNIPKGFDLDTFISKGEFSYPVKEKTIKLQVLFDKSTAAHLFETPLSEDQVLTETKEGQALLKATVKNTSELRWWLLGFGDQVEVLKPKKLREEFAEKFRKLNEMYG